MLGIDAVDIVFLLILVAKIAGKKRLRSQSINKSGSRMRSVSKMPRLVSLVGG